MVPTSPRGRAFFFFDAFVCPGVCRLFLFCSRHRGRGQIELKEKKLNKKVAVSYDTTAHKGASLHTANTTTTNITNTQHRKLMDICSQVQEPTNGVPVQPSLQSLVSKRKSRVGIGTVALCTIRTMRLLCCDARWYIYHAIQCPHSTKSLRSTFSHNFLRGVAGSFFHSGA